MQSARTQPDSPCRSRVPSSLMASFPTSVPLSFPGFRAGADREDRPGLQSQPQHLFGD